MKPETRKKIFRWAATALLLPGSFVILAAISAVGIVLCVLAMLFYSAWGAYAFVKSFGKSGGTDAGSAVRAHHAGVSGASALPGETWLYGWRERQGRPLQSSLEKENGPAAAAPTRGATRPSERKSWLQ
jgi:hypothetical protein